MEGYVNVLPYEVRLFLVSLGLAIFAIHLVINFRHFVNSNFKHFDPMLRHQPLLLFCCCLVVVEIPKIFVSLVNL